MSLYRIEIDGGYPKRKRISVPRPGRATPALFKNREAARQFIRNHNLATRNPKIVPV